MRARFVAVFPMMLLIGALALSGCDSSQSSTDSNLNARADFVAGAFPPTLSGEDYHLQPWTRTDCLICHEQGVDKAPPMRHTSVPEIAASAKCRTCHVLIVEDKAPK